MSETASMNYLRIDQLPRFGIADARRLFGLTARALRFYEEKGLFEARRDRFNMRYYDPVARHRLMWIARLRKAKVPLEDIDAVLRSDDPDARLACAREKLARRRMAAALELAAVDEALAELEGLVPATRPRRFAPTAGG
jgi:DNA-binding transcriptional MerR regulator